MLVCKAMFFSYSYIATDTFSENSSTNQFCNCFGAL